MLTCAEKTRHELAVPINAITVASGRIALARHLIKKPSKATYKERILFDQLKV